MTISLPSTRTHPGTTGRLLTPTLLLIPSPPVTLALASRPARDSQPAPPRPPTESSGLWLRNAAAGLGAPVSAFDAQQPWVVAVELAELEYLRLGYDPEQGVEQQLVRRARNDHKSTDGLETVNDELGGLETLSRDDQVRVLDQTLDELKDAPSDMRLVVSAWRRGDAPRLAAVLSKEYQGFPTLYRPLVTVRNQHWLPQIEQLLQGDRNCLVVVGALHLVGKGGLLELLHQDGYRPVQLN